MIEQAPSIYESFNARSLTKQQLCDSFIVSDYFKELASSSHTIMIGPRGSGKTTLMRMLQAETLDMWSDSVASSFREQVSFSGVFIPTDRFWKTQYDKIKLKLIASPDIEPLLISSFTYHTLERLISAVEFRAKRSTNGFKKVDISKLDEIELVTELAELWCVKPKIASLRSLEVAVTNKKKEVSDFVTLLADKTPNSSTPPQIISGEISSILGSSVRIINAYFNERGEKWSFLFDELELAPEEIIQPLVDAMRGGPEDVIFKLSLSPFHEHLNVTSASDSSMNRQDLSYINLTGTSDTSGLSFSKQLCGNIFIRNGLTKEIDEYFEEPKKMNTKKTFKELAEKDNSFLEYLTSQDIDINNLDSYTEKDKLPTIRKIKFIAQLRNFYRKKDGLASRKKSPDSYAGFSNLCKAMEYNPRMLIGLMNKFIPIAKSGDPISIPQQLSCLSESFQSYKALLCTIAVESDEDSFITIYDLIEAIAEKFKEEIIGKTFNPEPKGTLTFQKDENIDYMNAIGFALNAGALIVDKDSDDPFHNLKDIRKARCRLSYLFSHKFSLLTSKPRKIELSDLLKGKNKPSIKVINPADTPIDKQMNIF